VADECCAENLVAHGVTRMSRKIVMSGMRATGRLHLGNYWGALRNWVDLQEERECYFMVADWHMFCTSYEETARLQENIREMVLDWLAAGIDPEKAVVFQQSRVPQHAELTLALGMVTPISWLENNPTYKEQLQELSKTKLSRALEEQGVLSATQREKVAGQKLETVAPDQEKVRSEMRTLGFLGYPVLQTADIVLYGAHEVPVGKDQMPHVEISREIVRRFNGIYADTLVEPKGVLTQTPKVNGTDGRKMSKSYGNALDLTETPESLGQKVMKMYTDPTRIRKDDPGHPEPCEKNPPGCSVFALHKLYGDDAPARKMDCEQGKIGCVGCKKDLLKFLEEPFGEFRERRETFAKKGLVEDILMQGSEKARERAERTMEKVRAAMNLR
jgi:tryptophanyl-tRNA synthetase